MFAPKCPHNIYRVTILFKEYLMKFERAPFEVKSALFVCFISNLAGFCGLFKAIFPRKVNRAEDGMVNGDQEEQHPIGMPEVHAIGVTD